ncbi:hypothetical protein EO238_28390, partial [Citrobacter sp. AAK_AS5]
MVITLIAGATIMGHFFVVTQVPMRVAEWLGSLALPPLAVLLARPLAWRAFRGKSLVEALVALPLVLPPTVLGFYLLVALGD